LSLFDNNRSNTIFKPFVGRFVFDFIVDMSLLDLQLSF